MRHSALACRTALFLAALMVAAPLAPAATMYSTKDSYMGPGSFWGPGKIGPAKIFDVIIPQIGFSSHHNFVTQFRNNGGAEPNICGEAEMGLKPTGFLSDGVTKINEQVNACTHTINGMKMLVAVVEGKTHNGRQVAVTTDDGTMIMTMDFALDMGIGKSGVIMLPFYGTTGEVTIPYSLQTQLGIEGGVDQAGDLASGAKLSGRYGDFDGDGMVDGAIAVAGNMPMNSIFMPGAPFAILRYFSTDIPYNGKVAGRLPGPRYTAANEPPSIGIEPPTAMAAASSGAAPAKAKEEQR